MKIKKRILTAIEIDIRFLSDKYGIERDLAIELITDMIEGNFKSLKENDSE